MSGGSGRSCGSRRTSCRLLTTELHHKADPQCSILADEIKFGIAAIIMKRSELQEEVFSLVHLGDGVVLVGGGPLLNLVLDAAVDSLHLERFLYDPFTGR